MTEKIILFLLCIIPYFPQSDIQMMLIVSILASVIVSSVNSLLDEIEKYSLTLLVFNLMYYISCFFYPILSIMLPLNFYDRTGKKYGISVLFCILPFIMAYKTLTLRQSIIWIVLSFLAVLLELKNQKLKKAENRLISIRDDITEKNILLTDKNKSILENQEYEIHLATLRERNRIAADIHDNVGHMISRSILQIGALMVIEKNENTKKILKELNTTLGNAMTSMRESVHNLHNESIDLDISIKEIIKSIPENISCKMEYDKCTDMSTRSKLCIISILKEATANLIRHSNADIFTVTLREHPAFYQLVIKDNGTVSVNKSENGIGISNMAQRVHSLGGTFHNETTNGYKIFISIPKENLNESTDN